MITPIFHTYRVFGLCASSEAPVPSFELCVSMETPSYMPSFFQKRTDLFFW